MRNFCLALVTSAALLACSSSPDAASSEPSGSTSEPVDVTSTSVSITTPASSQLCEPVDEDSESIVVDGGWSSGPEQRTLEVTIEKTQSGTGAATTLVELQSIELPEGGRAFSWTNSETAITSFGLPDEQRATVESIIDRVPRIVLDYETDRSDAFVSVTNPEQIRSDLLLTVELLNELDPDPSVADFLRFYEELSHEQIGLIVAQEPILYHALGGVVLEPNAPVVSEALLENPLGIEPFPAFMTTSIDQLVGDDGCVHASMRTVPVPAELSRIMGESLAATFGGDGDFPEATIENEIRAIVDGRSGQVLRIEAVKFVMVGDESAVETTTIVDVSSR